MYNLKMKEATYRYRLKNKDKYNAYTNNLMKKSYCPLNKHEAYLRYKTLKLYKEECKIFRSILIDQEYLGIISNDLHKL